MSLSPLEKPKAAPAQSPEESLTDIRASIGADQETLRALEGKANPYQIPENLEKLNKEDLKKGVASILLYLLMPEKKESDASEGIAAPLPTPLPAIPEEPKAKQNFFMAAIANKESGAKPEDLPTTQEGKTKQYYHYVNFDAKPELSRLYNIGSTELFKKGLPGTLEEFKDKCLSNKPPITPSNLGQCAIGKYQIIPKFHFERMGWDPKGWEDLYNFLKKPELQEALMIKMTEEYETVCKGDFTAMAIMHYAGPERAKQYLKNPNAAVFKNEQALGYPSILSYARSVAAHAGKLKTQTAHA